MPPARRITNLQRTQLFAVRAPSDIAPPRVVEGRRRLILVPSLPKIIPLVLPIGVPRRRQRIVVEESLTVVFRPPRPSRARNIPCVEQADVHVWPFACQYVLDARERPLALPIVRPDPAGALWCHHWSTRTRGESSSLVEDASSTRSKRKQHGTILYKLSKLNSKHS